MFTRSLDCIFPLGGLHPDLDSIEYQSIFVVHIIKNRFYLSFSVEQVWFPTGLLCYVSFLN